METVLFRHFEKGLLALGCLFALVAARPTFAKPAEVALTEGFSERMDFVRHHFETYQPVLPPLEDNVTPLRACLGAPEPIEELPRWVCHRRPNLACDVFVPPPPPPSSHVAPKLELVVGHSCVTLTWRQGEGNECVVTGYVISRTDANGKTIVLKTATEPGTFVDDTAQPRESYTYSVLESADAPVGHAALDVKTVELAAEKPATLPRDLVIQPTRWVNVDPLMKTGDVKVWVNRWKDGQWLAQEVYPLKIGEKIGKKYPKGDFSTGAELLDAGLDGKVGWIKVKWPSGLEETLRSDESYEGLTPRRN